MQNHKKETNIRRANTCDPVLKLLNEEITSHLQKHKQNIWKEHLDAHWDHSISFINKIMYTPKTYCELFNQTIHKPPTHKTNRSIDRETQNIQGYNITLTTSCLQLHPCTHHIVTPGFMDIPHRGDDTAGCWTTSGKIGLPSPTIKC